MSDQIDKRIYKQLGSADLIDALADKLSGSDLHSLLLSVVKRRIANMSQSQLTQPNLAGKACDLDGRLLNRMELLAYQSAANFQAIELSPVTPLGAVNALAGLDQGNVLSTIRGLECASDPTVGMALECARHRKPSSKKNTERDSITKLCTSQRVIRYPLPTNPAYSAHFKLFAMVSAGRDTGSFAFEAANLKEHIDCYLTFLRSLKAEGFDLRETIVEISDTRVVTALCEKLGVSREEIRSEVRARDGANSAAKLLAKYPTTWPQHVANPAIELEEFGLPTHLLRHLELLCDFVIAPLQSQYADVSFRFNLHRLTGLSYYTGGPCFHIKVSDAQGQSYMLGDGGFVPWTQALLGDNKERLMTSAIGLELLARVFGSN